MSDMCRRSGQARRRKDSARSLVVIVLLVFGACGSAGESFDWREFMDPGVDYRPWVRWWWPGGDVEDGELEREVALLAGVGFGGAEIQPFDAALDPNAPGDEMERRRSFDSDSYYGHLLAALDAAREHGIAVDLTLGSGWPTGGMHVDPGKSMKALLWAEQTIEGPERLTWVITEPDKPVFYEIAELAATLGEPLARYLPHEAELVRVVAARVTGGLRDPDPFILTDTLELDRASITDLTDAVGSDGELQWDAPVGTWQVLAFFMVPDGEFPSLNAQTEPGFVLDHFDRFQLEAHLDHLLGLRTGLEEYHGVPLRGFFNDSFELENERHFTGDFLVQFEALRGYDLTPWLPVVVPPGADNHIFDGAGVFVAPPFRFGEEDGRVRSDYRRTVSDLFIERFVSGCSEWAQARDMLSRIQPYGIGVDVIRAAGEAHIPEAEQLYAGGSDLLVKLVASGAHLYGRNLVSAEALVWAERTYMTTPTKMKAAADKLFVAGVNHLVMHGFPYHKPGDPYGETGWHPFCSPFSGMGTYSSNVSEASPFWPWMERVNRYLARCQYALRTGKPDVDVLVYYPWLGALSTLARMDDHQEDLYQGRFEGEPDFPGNPLFGLVEGFFGPKDLGDAVEWMQALWPTLQVLEAAGYTWDWVNDQSLALAREEHGGIAIRDARYRAVLVADVEAMEPDAAEALASLADSGSVVVFTGNQPRRQRGYLDHEAGDQAVRDAMERVLAGDRTVVLPSPQGLPAALVQAGLEPVVGFTTDTTNVIRQVRRRLEGGGRVVFLRNPGGILAAGARIRLPPDCDKGQWVDAWTGGLSAVSEAGEEELVLPPHGSRFLLCGAGGPPAGIWTTIDSPAGTGIGTDWISLGEWTLVVEGGDVPGSFVELEVDELPDWRERDELRHSGGPGTYRSVVTTTAPGPGERAFLDLGWIHSVAEVRVNGQEAGVLLAPPWRIEVGPLLTEGDNVFEVVVTPPLRNRLIGKALDGDESAVQFLGMKDTLAPAGLVGPVYLETGIVD